MIEGTDMPAVARSMNRLKPPKEMRKTIQMINNLIILDIRDAPIELAIAEMEATKATILAIDEHGVHGNIDMKNAKDALVRAKELIANGWAWQ